MRILHTADVHLKEPGDERWRVMERLLELASNEEVDALVVAGDLFDADVDAERLRPEIRDLFTNTGFRILLLPGNHDRDSYGRSWFGEDVTVLRPLESVLFEGLAVCGLPYEDIDGEELVARIRSLDRLFGGEEETRIVVYHGELVDALPYQPSRWSFGDEGEHRYMPVQLSYFEDLRPDYILAGHFHANFDARQLGSGGYFVYPGSPVSITRRETGRRRVNLFDVGEPPRAVPLDTPHYEDVVVRLKPSDDSDPVQTVKARLEACHFAAKPLLRVEGYVDCEALDTTEAALAEKILAAGADCADCQIAFRDISRILQNELFGEFRRRLEADTELADQREDIVELVLQAMMEAGL
jgi:DNA repair exonuclease SbcCD nuclease subunit